MKRDSKKSNKKIRNDYQKKLTIAILEKIERECRTRNSQFLILDIPLRISRKKFSSKFPYGYTGDANPFSVISPIEKFKEESGKQIYWEKGDGHFTPLGCDLVGKALADHIYNTGLLSPKEK